MKFKTIGLGLLASTALVTAAEARLSAGLYNIGNIQELCLHSDGTWDSPTYSNWGGTWLNNTTTGAVVKGLIRGNFFSGYGNDSIAVKGNPLRGAKAGWNEWEDNETYNVDNDPITFSKIGSSCTDARKIPWSHVNGAHPAD